MKNFNGGVLSTAGGLVFEGSQTNDFSAYKDDTGEKLWSFDAQTGVIAGPASYELDGVQYIAVMAGWGGTVAPYGTHSEANGPARLLVFKLGGTDKLPAKPAYAPPPIDPPAQTETAAVVAEGEGLYGRYCQRCHGAAAAGGGLGETGPSDLRRSPFIQDQAGFDAVVREGQLQHKGMAAFGDEVTEDRAKAIRAYIVGRAIAAKKVEAAQAKTAAK
jgi:mono/diheme cytochrome c family protein